MKKVMFEGHAIVIHIYYFPRNMMELCRIIQIKKMSGSELYENNYKVRGR